MATDIFIREGLNSQQMAELCQKYRDEFDVKHVELVDIIEIIEFRIPELFPGFRLIIKQNEELDDYAKSDPVLNRIVVRESVYDSACDGDAFCRFVLAHELGHFLLHAGKGKVLHKSAEQYDAAISKMTAIESAEIQADMFASYLLIDLKLAYKLKNSPAELAARTGTSVNVAKTVISGVKRASFRPLIQAPTKTYAQKEREGLARERSEKPDV